MKKHNKSVHFLDSGDSGNINSGSVSVSVVDGQDSIDRNFINIEEGLGSNADLVMPYIK
jgi:hypothetical protein